MLPQGINVNAQQTLSNVSFSVEQGEWVTLLGANGSGKSTLARLANGLLLPTKGEVVADGISSWQHEKIMELRKKVGLVTQDPDNQIVSTTVFDEVAFGPQNLSWEPKRIYAVVSEALARVGLNEEEFAKRDPNTLSGGEKQRVVIAAVLAMQPEYLVLDEPTAMLDPAARMQVLKAVKDASEEGHGVLHITHYLNEAALSKRVLVLNCGALVYDGTPEGILEDHEALRAYGLMAEPRVRGPLQNACKDSSASGFGMTINSEEHSYCHSEHPSCHSERPSCHSERSEESFTSSATQEIPKTQAASSPEETQRDSLVFNDVSFSYPNTAQKKSVLTACNLTLKRGECMLLVGASGSGKSTVLSLAAGILQPDSGTVLLGKKPPVPGHIGLVFQQPENQLFAQTIEEDILFGPKNLGLLNTQSGSEIVDKALKSVGLDTNTFKKRSPYSLSGGEARRVALATTLALQTDFLLLDEPTAGLDARGRVFVYELLQRLMAEGTGIMLATHDPAYFEDLATSRMEL